MLARQRLFGLTHVGKDGDTPVVIRRAIGRHAHAAGGAVQQLHAERDLELLEQRRGRGLREPQAIRGSRDPTGLDYADEDLHRLQLVHRYCSGI